VKNITTGETSGAPLDHEEWIAAQVAAQAEEQQAKQPKPAAPAPKKPADKSDK
jgi:hypothetical protein